ncbi:hypothetical protein AB0L99_11890 [Streptomyces sp. NPDC051954]|uniref:hypothetical protein n=1 Tax=Streptomyces sp. NPDC051954 TaxID=3155524 RepID=UPI0034157692
MIRLLLADDEDLLRGALAALLSLEEDLTVVAEAATATDAVLRRALLAGVRVFVPKTTPAARPAEIIRDIAAGRRYVDPDIAASALTEDDCPLTDRELEVLRVARTGASITEIAAAVHLAPGTAAHRAWEQGWI